MSTNTTSQATTTDDSSSHVTTTAVTLPPTTHTSTPTSPTPSTTSDTTSPPSSSPSTAITPTPSTPSSTASTPTTTSDSTSTDTSKGTTTTITSTHSEIPNESSTSAAAAATTSGSAGLASPSNSGSGPTASPKTIAIATVIPIVVVVLAILAGIWFWRKRRDRRKNEEMRRKEMEEYGFNPNNDPSLPPVGSAVEEESSAGYRGWGTTSTARKASTNMSSQPAITRSDSGGQGGNGHPSPPTGATRYSDGNSGDPLVRQNTDGVGALGVAPAAAGNRSAGVTRGPSNASSAYSLGNYSDVSALSEGPLPNDGPQDYGAFVHPNEMGHKGGDNTWGGQPVIRDVSARRNTQIENPAVSPHQGSAGISQNF